MGIRDRIRGLGRQVAERALDRAGELVDRYLPGEPVQTEPPPQPPPDQYVSHIPATELNERHLALLQEEEIAKAVRQMLPEIQEEAQDPKSLFWDPFALVEQLGFREKPTAITYGTLKAITYKMPVIDAIITTRLNQLAAFCHPQQDQYSMGFQIRLRDHKKRPSRAVQAELERLEIWMMQTGANYDIERDNFESFTRKVLWDSLVYDQLNFEVVPSRKNRPAEIYAVDAATIRLADVPRMKRQEGNQKPKTVQIYDSSVIAEYAPEEMAFCVRNPRSDIRSYGYGVAELERLISTVTSMLWAWNYNQNAFSQGSLQKGLLNLKGSINQKQMRAFRRHWYQSLAGAANSWRTPILNATEGVEWVKMQDSNKDMEFSAWFDFLLKIACAEFGMDPIEVNFQYGASQRSRPMFEGANKARLVESRDRGLKPTLRFYQQCLNRYIIWQIEQDFELSFMGLNAATKEELAKINKERVTTIFTVNEVRQEQDLDPLEGGDVILNPVFMQGLQLKQQQEMMAQGGGPDQNGNGGQLGMGPGFYPGMGEEGQEGRQKDGDEPDEATQGFLAALDELDEESEKSEWTDRDELLIDFAI